jgi:hypothetical protein
MFNLRVKSKRKITLTKKKIKRMRVKSEKIEQHILWMNNEIENQ